MKRGTKRYNFNQCYFILKEEFEDTKGVIRIRTSKKNRQHNGQKKEDKMTNNDLQSIHIKRVTRTPLGMN